MPEQDGTISALRSAYDALSAQSIKTNEGPNGPLRLQCKQILEQINHLSSPVSFKVKIDSSDIAKNSGAWQLWKTIIACTLAAPVGFIMLLLLHGLSVGNSPEFKRQIAQREEKTALWNQAMAACELQNVKLPTGMMQSEYCKNKLLANGMVYPY